MGVLDRFILRGDQWDQMSRHIVGDNRTRGPSGRDNRMFVETVLWIVRMGSPWRDLPDMFGGWSSVFRRFSRWSQKSAWWRLFETKSDDSDLNTLSSTAPSSALTNTPPVQKGLRIRPLAVLAAA